MVSGNSNKLYSPTTCWMVMGSRVPPEMAPFSLKGECAGRVVLYCTVLVPCLFFLSISYNHWLALSYLHAQSVVSGEYKYQL